MQADTLNLIYMFLATFAVIGAVLWLDWRMESISKEAREKAYKQNFNS